MDDARFYEALHRLATLARPTDATFADALEAEAANAEDPESRRRVGWLVESWAGRYGEREPYWTYHRFSREASYALEDGVDRLAAETEAAFVDYAEGVTSLDKTPAEHQSALEGVRDAKRAEILGLLVATVEALGTRAGIRVRHAAFTRALDRCVPTPLFTVEYRASHRENPGELAATGALLGTAALPGIGTAVGGLAGLVGGLFVHGKTPEASVERQKAWIVQAGSIVRTTIEEANGDAAELADAQTPYAGEPVSSDEASRIFDLYGAARPFLPEGGG